MKPLSRRLSIFFLGLFILLSLITVLRHEMWRDELQAWLLAKDQTSFGDLAQAARYEKHPLAWFVILFWLNRLTASPLVMQLFHVGLAAISAWLVLRFAPFNSVQKILLVFSYYLFFEYNVISRNYALGVLALFLFCLFLTRDPARPFPPAVSLFVLANTSLYGLLLAFAGGIVMLARILSDRGIRKKWASYAALSLVIVGGLIFLISVMPAHDAFIPKTETTFQVDRLSAALRILPKSFVAMPRPTFHFWNTSVLEKVPSNLPVNAALALLILAIAAALLRKSPTALAFFSLSTAEILAWSYVGRIGFVRHYGHLFIAFIAALWIAQGLAASRKSLAVRERRRPARSMVLSGVLTAILAIQAAGGLFAAGMDIAYPFSQAKGVASFIKEKGYTRHPIVGEMDYIMTPVSGYLGRRIYYVRGKRLGSYVKWDMKRFKKVNVPLILDRAEQYAWKKHKDCLILLNFHLDPGLEQPGYLTKLLATGPAIVAGEVYRLYLLKYSGPPSAKPSQSRP